MEIQALHMLVDGMANQVKVAREDTLISTVTQTEELSLLLPLSKKFEKPWC